LITCTIVGVSLALPSCGKLLHIAAQTTQRRIGCERNFRTRSQL